MADKKTPGKGIENTTAGIMAGLEALSQQPETSGAAEKLPVGVQRPKSTAKAKTFMLPMETLQKLDELKNLYPHKSLSRIIEEAVDKLYSET